MTHEEGIHTTGRIVEVLAEGRCHAALPNGKIVFAFPSKALVKQPLPQLAKDDLLSLRLTPYDFSKAEITGPAEAEK